ncbi:hypothetical protein ABMA27_016955 [Loxostege sticticalis]|uniref:CCHC-type domain-containing protein n=1 Tax=Loxostege sticticalis TaxID=481309 RepID=A0ABR3GZH0_LOXSC
MANEGVKLEYSGLSTLPVPGERENTSVSFLTKFIKPFDGDRNKLSSFLRNCENALNLANKGQSDILFKYILSQLEGKAETACSLKIFDSWIELKSFLKSTFGETKHREHLLLDLQNCKQKPNESVSQYSLRIETCLTRLQTDIIHSTTDKTELKGRIANTEDLALHTFLLGIPSHISTILRCRNPSSLSEAINLANQEEKLFNFAQSSRTPDLRPKCRNCGRMGHLERQCMLNRQRPVFTVSNGATTLPTSHQSPRSSAPFQPPRASTSSQAPTSQQTPTIFCRYCKYPGHDIQDCRKRQYNNNLRQNQNRQVHYVSENYSYNHDDNNNYYDNIQSQHESISSSESLN